MKDIFILGIDGAFPEYIFGEWLEELPNIKKLVDEGTYAKMNSTIPPLSVTAWSSILTGKTPTDTGLFEYIYRKNYSYDDIRVVTARNLKDKTIWQILSDYDRTSIVCNILLTWPIRPFKGSLIAGPLTPDGADFVYPEELKKELEEIFLEIPPVDVPGFRN